MKQITLPKIQSLLIFIAHKIKEIEVKSYGGYLQVPSSIRDIYRYSNTMLKYTPEKVLGTFEKTLFFLEKKLFCLQN